MLNDPKIISEGMLLADFLDAQQQHPFELIDGERLDKIPNVFGHSWYIRWLFRVLDAYVIQHQLGEVFTESTYVQIADEQTWVKGSRIPDIVFYSRERIQQFQAQNPNWCKLPLTTSPDLTIEVISPTERATDITKKVRADMRHGVKMMWAVDIETQTVTVYEGDQAQILGVGAVLEGQSVLPNFRLPLADLFKQEMGE